LVPTTELSLKIEFSGTDGDVGVPNVAIQSHIIQSRVIETLRLISGALSPVQEMYYA